MGSEDTSAVIERFPYDCHKTQIKEITAVDQSKDRKHHTDSKWKQENCLKQGNANVQIAIGFSFSADEFRE